MNKYEDFEIAGIYDRALKYLLAISIILFCVFYNNISYALGFVLGGITCLVNFRLMVKSLEDMAVKRTYSKAFFNGYYLLRLGLTTTILIGAMILESVNLFTAVLGILTIRIVVTWEAIVTNSKRQKSME